MVTAPPHPPCLAAAVKAMREAQAKGKPSYVVVTQQVLNFQVPQGMQGGMPVQVLTPTGLVQVPIPPGLGAGAIFQILVPTARATAPTELAG